MATTRPEPNAPSDARVPEKKQRNPWIWVCALLAVVAAGLLIWALSVQSDLDTTQKQVNDLQAEVDRSQSAGGQLVASAKGVVDDLSAQLGATSDDLEQTQQDLEDSKQATADAEQAAAAAEDAAGKAKNEADKLSAEADQAKAEVQAAEGKARVAADCAKAYVSALGSIFGGEAATVRDKLQSITADCKTALGGA